MSQRAGAYGWVSAALVVLPQYAEALNVINPVVKDAYLANCMSYKYGQCRCEEWYQWWAGMTEMNPKSAAGDKPAATKRLIAVTFPGGMGDLPVLYLEAVHGIRDWRDQFCTCTHSSTGAEAKKASGELSAVHKQPCCAFL